MVDSTKANIDMWASEMSIDKKSLEGKFTATFNPAGVTNGLGIPPEYKDNAFEYIHDICWNVHNSEGDIIYGNLQESRIKTVKNTGERIFNVGDTVALFPNKTGIFPVTMPAGCHLKPVFKDLCMRMALEFLKASTQPDLIKTSLSMSSALEQDLYASEFTKNTEEVFLYEESATILFLALTNLLSHFGAMRLAMLCENQSASYSQIRETVLKPFCTSDNVLENLDIWARHINTFHASIGKVDQVVQSIKGSLWSFMEAMRNIHLIRWPKIVGKVVEAAGNHCIQPGKTMSVLILPGEAGSTYTGSHRVASNTISYRKATNLPEGIIKARDCSNYESTPIETSTHDVYGTDQYRYARVLKIFQRIRPMAKGHDPVLDRACLVDTVNFSNDIIDAVTRCSLVLRPRWGYTSSGSAILRERKQCETDNITGFVAHAICTMHKHTSASRYVQANEYDFKLEKEKYNGFCGIFNDIHDKSENRGQFVQMANLLQQIAQANFLLGKELREYTGNKLNINPYYTDRLEMKEAIHFKDVKPIHRLEIPQYGWSQDDKSMSLEDQVVDKSTVDYEYLLKLTNFLEIDHTDDPNIIHKKYNKSFIQKVLFIGQMFFNIIEQTSQLYTNIRPVKYAECVKITQPNKKPNMFGLVEVHPDERFMARIM